MYQDRVGRSGRNWWIVAMVVTIATALSACGSTSPAADVPPSRPERIVSLIPQVTEIIVALGESHRLVSRIASERDSALLHLPDIGDPTRPNLELIADLDPDFIIVWEGTEPARHLRSLLGDSRVWMTRSERIDDLWSNLTEVGVRLHREAEAGKLAHELQADITAVVARVSGLTAPSVFYLVWEDPPYTVGPGSFVHELIEIAGGQNAFSDAPVPWPPVSFESLVQRNPDLVLWPRSDARSQPLIEREGWRVVPAVARGDVIILDRNLFERPGVHIGTAARTLATVLHPKFVYPDTTQPFSEVP